MQKSPADGPGGGQASGKITICIYHKIPAGGVRVFCHLLGDPGDPPRRRWKKSRENPLKISLKFLCFFAVPAENFKIFHSENLT